MSFINDNNPLAVIHRNWNLLMVQNAAVSPVLGGNFVATGFGGAGDVKYSSDAINWTLLNTGFQVGPIVQITETEFIGVSVTVTDRFFRVRSINGGLTWTFTGGNALGIGSLSGCITGLNQIAWNGSIYVLTVFARGIASIFSSPDCLTWTLRLNDITNEYLGCFWSGTEFVAFSNNYNTSPATSHYVTSADGITWSFPGQLGGNLTLIKGIKTPTGRYIFAGASNSSASRIHYSDALLGPWTVYQPFPDVEISAIAQNSTTICIGAPFSRFVWYSTNNGVSFTRGTFPAYNPADPSANNFAITYKNGLFVSANTSGRAFYSADGITFSQSAVVGGAWRWIA